MSLQSPRTWVVGGALLALVLAVLGWYVAIAPQRDLAVSVRSQVEAAESAEDLQEVRLAQLRDDFVQLPQHQADLAAARQTLPVALDLPALTRDLTSAASAAGVTLMGVAPAVPASGATTTDGPATGVTTDEAASTDSAASAASAAATTPGMQTVGLKLTVIGQFSAATEFLRAVQGLDHPSVLVTGLTITGQKPSEAGDGRPATVNGDVELEIDAAVFTLPTAS